MLTLILIILFSCRIYYNPSPLFEEYKNYRNQKHELELVQCANTCLLYTSDAADE